MWARLLCVVVVCAGLGLAGGHVPVAIAQSGEYKVGVDKAATVVVGKRGSVSLSIAAAAGRTISKQGPLVVAVSAKPATGLGLTKTRYRRRDAADARAANPRFDVRFTGKTAGRYELSLEARFWVCARRTCRPVVERLQSVVTVTEPAPPADAGPPGPSASP